MPDDSGRVPGSREPAAWPPYRIVLAPGRQPAGRLETEDDRPNAAEARRLRKPNSRVASGDQVVRARGSAAVRVVQHLHRQAAVQQHKEEALMPCSERSDLSKLAPYSISDNQVATNLGGWVPVDERQFCWDLA
jgi:hypothetical protein